MSLLGLATDAFYQAAGSNPASYETDRSDLHMKVMRSPAKDVRKSMEEYLTKDSIVKVGKIPTNFDIFPSERQKTVAAILEVFDAERHADWLAVEISHDMSRFVGRLLSEQSESKQHELALAVAGAANPTFAAASEQCEQAMPLSTFLKRLGDTEEAEQSWSHLFKRRVAAAVSMHLIEAFVDSAAMKDCNLQIELANPGMGKASKLQVVRRGPGHCHLPFFGKVVEEQAAAMASRVNVLPLGDGGKGLRLFVDGTSFCNPKRSDVCVAWLLPRAAKEKDAEEEVLQPKKKAKTTASPPSSHAIQFESFEVQVDGTTLEYEVPYLVDIEANKLMEGKCIREYLPWDSVELAKPKKTITSKLSFAHK